MNATDLCEGVITRERIAGGRMEKAVLDFFVVCKAILHLIKNMSIDTDKKLTNFSKKKTVESDHIPLILNLNIKPPQKSSSRMEIFNYKNTESLAAFKEETSKSTKLSDCFRNTNNTHDQVAGWMKKLNCSIRKCFKKIRIGGKKRESETSKLMRERMEIKSILKKSVSCEKANTKKLLKEKEAEITKRMEKRTSIKCLKTSTLCQTQLDPSILLECGR